MKKVYVIGMIDDKSPIILEKLKKAYPDHEIIMVKDITEVPAEYRPEFQAPPIPITKIDDIYLPKVDIQDMKMNNPWPSHHHSSKRNKRY